MSEHAEYKSCNPKCPQTPQITILQRNDLLLTDFVCLCMCAWRNLNLSDVNKDISPVFSEPRCCYLKPGLITEAGSL